MLPRRCILCCDTSITRLWHGQCVSSSALKATKSWRAGFLNGSLRSGRISSSIGETVWSACLLDGSRVRRESHARFCERRTVKFHRPTQPVPGRPDGPGIDPACRNLPAVTPTDRTVARFSRTSACAVRCKRGSPSAPACLPEACDGAQEERSDDWERHALRRFHNVPTYPLASFGKITPK